jgi:hypothetical protein
MRPMAFMHLAAPRDRDPGANACNVPPRRVAARNDPDYLPASPASRLGSPAGPLARRRLRTVVTVRESARPLTR